MGVSKNPELSKLAEELRARYGPPVREILFFGSRTRGDYSEESDYDCLLVFHKVSRDLKRDLDRLAAQWLLERGIVFSWVAVSEADLEQLRYEPFLQNARRDGIAL
jgi:predicted nucleotidyltransferase